MFDRFLVPQGRLIIGLRVSRPFLGLGIPKTTLPGTEATGLFSIAPTEQPADSPTFNHAQSHPSGLVVVQLEIKSN
jgi:hypothetical protein